MDVVIPCSDDLRHPDGTVYSTRILPSLFLSRSDEVADGFYPLHSPHRCFHCAEHFATVPLFYPRSVVYQTCAVLVEWAGHYCSVECRTRAVDDLRDPERENHFMNIVRMDAIVFPRRAAAFDYTQASRRHFDTPKAISTRTTLEPADVDAKRIRSCFEVRGVREIFYGKNEGGVGQVAIYEKLLEAVDFLREPPVTAPAPAIAPAARQVLRIVEARDRPGRGDRCWWCIAPGPHPPHVKIPISRDLTNTVRVQGCFCDWPCAVAFMLHEPSKSLMLQRHEHMGLLIYIAVTVHGYPHGFRPSVAPHRLELVEFGGDLTRQEFNAQCGIPDLLTCIDVAPFLSSRMPMNYTRPSVVCNLSQLGESSFEPQRIEVSGTTLPGTQPKTLFEELTGGTPGLAIPGSAVEE
jgi:hypothetical protein